MDEDYGPSVSRLERKLVTVRQITEIRQPFKLWIQRRAIIKVTGGWQVVVHQRHFKVGDSVLFFEPDSFIPRKAINLGCEMRPLRATFENEQGYHVQPRTVCKHESQGHITKIEDFHWVRHIVNIMLEEYGPEEGYRVAGMMTFEGVIGVKRFEAPEPDSNA